MAWMELLESKLRLAERTRAAVGALEVVCTMAPAQEQAVMPLPLELALACTTAAAGSPPVVEEHTKLPASLLPWARARKTTALAVVVVAAAWESPSAPWPMHTLAPVPKLVAPAALVADSAYPRALHSSSISALRGRASISSRFLQTRPQGS